MQPAIQTADPQLRRRAIFWSVIGMLAVAAIAHLLQRGLDTEQNTSALLAQLHLLVAILAFAAAPAYLGSRYLWLLGRRCIAAQRFPPPGFRTVRDTPILVGAQAVRRGRLARALAVMLQTAALLAPAALSRVLVALQ